MSHYDSVIKTKTVIFHCITTDYNYRPVIGIYLSIKNASTLSERLSGMLSQGTSVHGIRELESLVGEFLRFRCAQETALSYQARLRKALTVI